MGWLTESAMYSAGGAAKSKRRRAIVGNVRYEAAGTVDVCWREAVGVGNLRWQYPRLTRSSVLSPGVSKQGGSSETEGSNNSNIAKTGGA